jgi:hypothetical protein
MVQPYYVEPEYWLDDISGQSAEVQAICVAVHKDLT